MGRALIYGFFILLIYILMSLPFHFLDTLDPQILNTLSTNIVMNLIFFAVFVFFAFSFFGYYELTFPAVGGIVLMLPLPVVECWGSFLWHLLWLLYLSHVQVLYWAHYLPVH